MFLETKRPASILTYERIGWLIHQGGKRPLMLHYLFMTLGITRLLLDQNVNLHACNELGDTPLHGAMFGNRAQIVEMLIGEGWWVEVARSSCVLWTLDGDTGTFQRQDNFLTGAEVNRVNKKNQTPLYTAVGLRGNVQVGLSVQCYIFLWLETLCPDWDARQINIFPFYFQIIRVLLAAGSDMNICENEKHQSPLFAALLHEYVEIGRMLIAEGTASLRSAWQFFIYFFFLVKLDKNFQIVDNFSRWSFALVAFVQDVTWTYQTPFGIHRFMSPVTKVWRTWWTCCFSSQA